MYSEMERPPALLRREDFLQHAPIFSELEDDEKSKVAELLRERNYKKNELIFSMDEPGETLFFLKSGAVKVTVEARERPGLIIRYLYPPDFFGEMALFDNLPRSATVTAVEPSEAFILERGAFVTFAEENPAILLRVAKTLSRRLRKTNELVHNLAFLDAYGKVARVMLDIARERGQYNLQEQSWDVRLSQRELMQLTGMARGTIARVITDFRQAGYIRVLGSYITILESTILADRALPS